MHPEALTLKAKRIFDKLGNFPQFYLAGGTGLALQLGHRISIDFDLFWQKEIPKELFPEIKKIFKDFKIEVVVNHSEQLTINIGGVQLSFIQYPFPVISKFINYQGVKILPPLENAAMKAYALGRRATLKDYIDLYFVFKEGIGAIEDIIKLSKKKYGSEFEPRLFLEQLIYSKDIEDMKIQFLKKAVNKKTVEKFFEKEIKKIKF